MADPLQGWTPPTEQRSEFKAPAFGELSESNDATSHRRRVLLLASATS
jgi:hypothetical protein